ncbi:hypothetical protein [Sphingomonas xinjiangensis]|uniref:UrcA family protein n=1 Tax=Sphingomonas xinjiangensis TaxID=643568 RepID=A0A840YMJ7_9SPHN|nr:hypothetical protein [Sphingomonas xinjiangensis]MBB5711096.1 hypothetical protein [Sphingomonas xinjiangensis]
MLMAMFLASATISQAATQAVEEDEIVVMGQRLNRWTGKYQIRGAKRKCSTKTSSGDREVDNVGCAAFLKCADKYQNLTDAGDGKGISKATRNVLKQDLIGKMKTCITDQRAVLLRELSARRPQ